MGRALLGCQVVGIESQVPLTHLERDRKLPGRKTAKRRHPKLDDETSARTQVPSGVQEARDLLLLGSQVRDAVPYEVHERELAGNCHRRHVPNGRLAGPPGGHLVHLAPELGNHRLDRELDTSHCHTTGQQRDANPARLKTPIDDGQKTMSTRPAGQHVQACSGVHAAGSG